MLKNVDEYKDDKIKHFSSSFCDRELFYIGASHLRKRKIKSFTTDSTFLCYVCLLRVQPMQSIAIEACGLNFTIENLELDCGCTNQLCKQYLLGKVTSAENINSHKCLVLNHLGMNK